MNDDLDLRILRLFSGAGGEAWDLHSFFELAGDSRDRVAVLEIVDGLVARGYLESRGSDFFTRTERGRQAAERGALNG